jgi:formylglycine-generating enzyme required for sulfatase activity
MTCVAGGLFVRGSTLILRTTPPSIPERLVRLSPFAIDTTEMTVGAMRALVTAGLVTAPTARTADNACTYTTAPGEFESFPVSCVTRDQARKACAARGKRLPTEAEWEFAASGRDQEQRYPWGDDTDVCSYAIVGRGRLATELPGGVDLANVCRPQPNALPLPWGPRPVGESADVTPLGIRDLGGNVSEWVADELGLFDGPCSDGPRILVDPRCDRVNEKGEELLRGGSWNDYPLTAESARRAFAYAASSPFTGFRCAESL